MMSEPSSGARMTGQLAALLRTLESLERRLDALREFARQHQLEVVNAELRNLLISLQQAAEKLAELLIEMRERERGPDGIWQA